MARNRIKLKTSLVGSSDFRRFKSKVAILEMNHKKNVVFFESIKNSVKSDKPIDLTESDLLRRYREIRVMGTWCPISKYVGLLLFMYKEQYAMR